MFFSLHTVPWLVLHSLTQNRATTSPFFSYTHTSNTHKEMCVCAHTHTHKHTHKLNNLNETSKSMRVFQRENMLRSLIEKGLRLRSLHLHGPYFQALLFVSAPDNRLSIRSVQRRRQSSIRIITLGV